MSVWCLKVTPGFQRFVKFDHITVKHLIEARSQTAQGGGSICLKKPGPALEGLW